MSLLGLVTATLYLVGVQGFGFTQSGTSIVVETDAGLIFTGRFLPFPNYAC